MYRGPNFQMLEMVYEKIVDGVLFSIEPIADPLTGSISIPFGKQSAKKGTRIE